MKSEFNTMLSERLEELRILKGLSSKKLAEIADVDPANMWRFLKSKGGMKNVKLAGIKKICDEFKIDLNAFINPNADWQKSNNEYTEISYYDIKASAGGGMPVENNFEQKLSVFTDLLKNLKYNANDLNVVRVNGDSMMPTLHDGDFIFVLKNFNGNITQRIYLLNDIWGHLIVKRLSWSPDGELLVISDNKDYQTLKFSRTDLENGDIRIIGQVVGVLSVKAL